jgi:tRNA G18 (ribose-2'-O)-methylase SpoU
MISKIDWVSEEFSNQEVKDCLKPIRHKFEVAVYSSENYFNLGAIIRTCHNFLAGNIYSVDLPSYYKKASMAARRYEEVEKVDLDTFLSNLNGKPLIAFERRPGVDSKILYDFKWPENPIMFFGNEKFGVPDKVLEQATDIISIPVYGVLHDFNVAQAAAIAMYDWLQKHEAKIRTK